MPKKKKAAAMTEMDEDPLSDNSTALASIASMQEDHTAGISADFQSTFSALESRLEGMQTTLQYLSRFFVKYLCSSFQKVRFRASTFLFPLE